MIEQGGLTLDGEKILDTGATLARDRLLSADGVLVKRGKKHYYALKLRN
jgi:tyrosyl-tRNA synthetase